MKKTGLGNHNFSASGAEFAFFVRKHDFDPTILGPTTLRGVHVHRKLVAVAFHLNALIFNAEVGQHIGHCLSTITRQLQVFLAVAGAVGVALDPHHPLGVELQKLYDLQHGAVG